MGARGCIWTKLQQKVPGTRTSPRDAWEQASWDEPGSWEAEEDRFAVERREEALNLPGAQLNEALASARNARRTVAQARAIMHDIMSSCGGYFPQGANRKGSGQERAKAKDKARTETVVAVRRDSRREMRTPRS